MEAIATKILGNFAYDPRTENDNLGKMVCIHSRYKLGDDHNFSAGTLKDELDELINSGAGVVLPLYLYDHSGLTMNTTGFSCGWDSAQVGYIIAYKEDIIKEYGDLSAASLALARSVLEGEVKEYDQYLTGDVYYFDIEKDGEHVDSCGGFFGYKFVLEEAMGTLDYWHNEDVKQTETLKEAVNNYGDGI